MDPLTNVRPRQPGIQLALVQGWCELSEFGIRHSLLRCTLLR